MQLKLWALSWYCLCHPASGRAWLPWHASLWAGSSPVCSQHWVGDPWQQWNSACLAWGVAGRVWEWPLRGGTVWSSVPQCPPGLWAVLAPVCMGSPHPWVRPTLCVPSAKAHHATWFCHCCFHIPLPFVLSGRTKKEGEPHLISLCSLNMPSNRARFFLAGLQWLP